MIEPTTKELVRRAWKNRVAVPGFNIPFPEMMPPVVAALRDADCLGLISVARLEWVKFSAGSPAAVRENYERCKDERFTRLHLDHVPAIDEDGLRVDYRADIAEALRLGFDSVMFDGSRLPLEENIAATRDIVELARPYGAAVEAELGAILGHEAGPQPDYEELFASGKGFTDPDEAKRFVAATGCDWLSVAAGSIHGSIAQAALSQRKPRTRLNVEHLRKLAAGTDRPLVLHGGSGIPKHYVIDAIRAGIAKINVAANIRQPFLVAREKGTDPIQAVYDAATIVIREDLELAGTASRLIGGES